MHKTPPPLRYLHSFLHLSSHFLPQSLCCPAPAIRLVTLPRIEEYVDSCDDCFACLAPALPTQPKRVLRRSRSFVLLNSSSLPRLRLYQVLLPSTVCCVVYGLIQRCGDKHRTSTVIRSLNIEGLSMNPNSGGEPKPANGSRSVGLASIDSRVFLAAPTRMPQ